MGPRKHFCGKIGQARCMSSHCGVSVQVFARHHRVLRGRVRNMRGQLPAFHREQENLSSSVRRCIYCVHICLCTCISFVLIHNVCLFISRRQRLYSTRKSKAKIHNCTNLCDMSHKLFKSKYLNLMQYSQWNPYPVLVWFRETIEPLFVLWID